MVGESWPQPGSPPPRGVTQHGTSHSCGCCAGSQIPSPRLWLGATSHSLPCPWSQASCSGPGSPLPSATHWLSSPSPFSLGPPQSGAVADSVLKISVTSSVTPFALIVLSFLTTFSLGEPHFLHICTPNLEPVLNCQLFQAVLRPGRPSKVRKSFQHRILLLVGGDLRAWPRRGVTEVWPVILKILFAMNPFLR